VSKRLGSIYRRGRSPLWIKVKNPNAASGKARGGGGLGGLNISAKHDQRKLGTHSIIFDEREVILLLRAAIEREKTQVAFAKRHGILRTHLNQILSGKKSVNTGVMKALRLRKVYAPK
jgi:hypothetical protein